jgi:WD40 repeat protein
MTEVYNKIDFANPFPGLRSFDREDSHLFFGRDQQIKELKDMMSTARLLAIVGYSGSGKSSLIKAGLIPSLQRERQGWLVLSLSVGSDPFHSLATAIQRFFSDQNPEANDLDIEAMLRGNPQTLVNLFVEQQERVLVFIDQFEEIFRYSLDDAEAVHQQDDVALFIDLLLAATKKTDNPIYVVLTMRSDFLDYCTLYDGFTEAINDGSYLLPKMSSAEIRDVIVKPIEALGAIITPSLTEQLLKDTGVNSQQLPVLQHALMRTWAYWQKTASPDQPIDRLHYEAIGTMVNAISVHAEELYAGLPSDKLRLTTEKVFKSLIALGPDDRSIINPISINTIKEITGIPEYLLFDVVDRFRAREASFLLPFVGSSVGQDTVISISRGRIVQLWGRLQTWSQEETESAKLYKEIAKSAAQYQEGKTGLLTPPELQLALKWQKDNKPTLAWAQRYDIFFERAITYLEYSKDQYEFDVQSREKRQKQDIRQTRILAVTGISLAVVGIIAAIYFNLLEGEASQASKAAETSAQNARREQQNAENQTKEAISQSKIAKQLQEIAEQQRLLTEEQRTIAEAQRQEAQKQQRLAIIQSTRADNERTIAVQQKNLANAATQIASAAEKRARAASKISDSLKVLAEKTSEREKQNAKEANRLGMLAIAQSIAIKSLQTAETAKDSTPSLLSVVAYQLNMANGGQPNSPAIFAALSKASDKKTIFEGHRDNVRALAIKPDKSLIASASDDGTVRVRPLDPNRPVTVFAPARRLTSGFRSVLFSDDGNRLFAGSTDGRIHVWDMAQPKKGTFYGSNSSPIFALSAYRNGTQLISTSTSGSIRVWKLTAKGLDSIAHIKTGYKLYAAQLSPDGSHLVCGSDNGRLVTVSLDGKDREPIVTVRPEFRGSRISALAFSPDGKSLVTGSSAGDVILWNFSNNKVSNFPAFLPGAHSASVTGAIISPNGKLILTSSLDGFIRIWSEADNQQPPVVVADYRNWVMNISLSDDGNTLFYCGADQTIRAMNINTKLLYDKALKTAKGNLSDAEWNKLMAGYLAQPDILQNKN